MSVGRYPGNGLSNREGYTFPGPFFTSPWGQALRRGLSQLFAQPTPLVGQPQGDRHAQGPYHVGYAGIIGGYSILSASVVGLFDPSGYYGDFPQGQQPMVAAPPPWERD